MIRRYGALPIFPLPQVALFPRALLPLHVFEPRYRALTQHCLDGERLVALCMLEPGFEAEYERSPAVKPVCGVGEIVAHHRHPDGRFDLLVKGTARVRIIDELPAEPPRLFRMVNANALDDLYRPGEDLAIAHQSLVVLCDRLAGVLPSGGETLRALTRQESDPAATADVLAAALVTDPAVRQRLVEQLDVAARIEEVSRVVAGVLSRLEGAGGGSGAN